MVYRGTIMILVYKLIKINHKQQMNKQTKIFSTKLIIIIEF